MKMKIRWKMTLLKAYMKLEPNATQRKEFREGRLRCVGSEMA